MRSTAMCLWLGGYALGVFRVPPHLYVNMRQLNVTRLPRCLRLFAGETACFDLESDRTLFTCCFMQAWALCTSSSMELPSQNPPQVSLAAHRL
jgi:hypothetical protein